MASEGKLVGVAMVGRPVARKLCDGITAEVVRVCTDGTRNACSILYAACARAAKSLGYHRILTYTLESEPGVSLRAAGWDVDAEGVGGDPAKWASRQGPRAAAVDLFGNRAMPLGPKRRWVKML